MRAAGYTGLTILAIALSACQSNRLPSTDVSRIDIESEAYVIAASDAGLDPHVLRLVFKHASGDGEFTQDTDAIAQIHVVPGGYYYLRYILQPSHFRGEKIALSIPRDTSEMLSIPAGRVTYIGNWKYLEEGENAGIQEIEYKQQHIAEIKELYPWLVEYPLQISTPEGKTTNLTWN